MQIRKFCIKFYLGVKQWLKNRITPFSGRQGKPFPLCWFPLIRERYEIEFGGRDRQENTELLKHKGN